MNEQEVIRLYVEEDLTLRETATRMGTNHHMVRRILQRHGIPIVIKKRSRIFTEEHRRRISESNKGRKVWITGLKMDEASRRKNMKGRMGTSIDLAAYSDFEKLKLLTRLQAKWREHLAPDDATRQAFLDRFYFDEGFNAIYDAWLASGKNKWYYPSLDHKTPKASGANWSLDNLQFLTWFENRAKADMSQAEWDAFKQATNTRSDLFIDSILHN